MRDERPQDIPCANGGRRGGVPPLREALRRARVEAAERTDVVIGLKQAEFGRLEALRDALAPVFADLPAEIDIFDVGLVPGDRPRLFVDMVAFVEMARDRKTYRFLRDGRHGRAAIAESAEVQPIVDAVTSYVARRLVERERLLADDAFDDAGPAVVDQPAAAPVPPPVPKRPSPVWARLLAVLFAFGVGGAFGAALVIAVIVAAAKGLMPWFI
ncbi:hypothetical protein JOD31_002743 [Methylopila capsulata]|uniref:Uncharacterized protein n=1 Tax=Methylopila capsulata TaxID=61654 RepID=A0A9W6MSD9_9HYPH|nr:hypothetical protein [Methylopila capsulata]MBM7852501.1 hypothetical protein [Methylopila capsulata]GLK56710.1 hypothetical protein GCM10008170_27290 [Methylopila capsulata]